MSGNCDLCLCGTCINDNCQNGGCPECDGTVFICNTYKDNKHETQTEEISGHQEKLGEIISALDTAAGMLIVAAMKNQTVRKAMELISQASFDLGNLVDEAAEAE